MSARLTLINRFAFPDDSPTSRLMHDLAMTLAVERPDLDIRILTCNRRYSGSAEQLPGREKMGALEFIRLRVPSAARRGLLLRAAGYGAFYLQGFLKLLFSLRRGELVICMTDPPMFNVLATLAARLRGARVVHWVQDLYPDVVQSAGLMSRSAPLLSMLRGLRRMAYRASARLVVIGEGMRDRLLRDGSGCPIEIIPNWANAGSIEPVSREQLPLAREWLPSCRFVVGYFGNLGFAHNFQSALDAAALLREHSDVQFLWVGDGSRRLAFQQGVAALGLANVHWQGQQPFERMGQILGLADIHLVMLDPQFDEVLVPSKIYSAMAAGRALLFLGSPGSEVARLVREYGIGIAVALEDSQAIASAIRELASQPERCRQMGLRARALFDAEFERSRVMGRWQSLIGTLLPR